VESADIVIVPLRIGSGTRLKILEAMAMSKPVVSTSIGCEGLDVTSGENIVIADAPEDFANAVLKLMNDSQERTRIAESGRKLVEEKYSWEFIERNLAELIMSLRH
jgi:glycosyltransferase involved in cell wall biosynthesis